MKTCYYAGTVGDYKWSEKNRVNLSFFNASCCIAAVHAGKSIGNPFSYLEGLGIVVEKYGMAISQMDLGIADSEMIACLIELGKLLGIEVKHEDVLLRRN